jgi:lysozyme
VNTSDAGIGLIKAHEGCRYEAYPDSVGVPTIGYGHTKNVKLGDVCTEEQAEAWLVEDVGTAESCVNSLVSVPMTQGEFDALVSFTFNLGCHALRSSTLLIKLNNSDYDGACAEISKWAHAGGKVLPGLVARRKAEQEMFESTA